MNVDWETPKEKLTRSFEEVGCTDWMSRNRLDAMANLASQSESYSDYEEKLAEHGLAGEVQKL